MKSLKKIITIAAIVGIIILSGFAFFVYKNVLTPNTAFNNEEAHIYIATGADFLEVKEELAPLIKNMTSFERVAHRKGYSTHVKPGHFIIKKGMNNNAIINSIRVQNIPIKIKFNNQERIENLAGHIAKQIEADSLSLLKVMLDPIFLENNGFNNNTALGMYIPNTYDVYWNTSPSIFRNKMLKAYHAFWNNTRTSKAAALKLTKDQVMSLAAIVQKETVKIDERPRVAGVYINRLNSGWPLEADPTVIYAKKHAENNFNQVIKRVLYKDLEINSKYNTYKHAGVPPGPIAMPDISSIEAVLNRENHSFYFFVADVKNFGYHKFAKTLAQHNKNKRSYVKWISNKGVKR